MIHISDVLHEVDWMRLKLKLTRLSADSKLSLGSTICVSWNSSYEISSPSTQPFCLDYAEIIAGRDAQLQQLIYLFYTHSLTQQTHFSFSTMLYCLMFLFKISAHGPNNLSNLRNHSINKRNLFMLLTLVYLASHKPVFPLPSQLLLLA